jgi:acyl-CoA synthetase (AMP-forming)/AMP-acid ligase II
MEHERAMNAGWNYADVWEAVADRFGDRVALIHGDRHVTWRDFDERADGIAAALVTAGLGRQAKVAQYLRNGPEYLETLYGAFKAGIVPVNTNYRYGDEELRYLWSDCDAEAVIFDAEFLDVCARLRPSLPDVKLWLRVGGDSEPPPWVIDYEQVAATRPGRFRPPWDRSGDDLYLLYTGGTTGMPKGVMWRQDDLYRMLEAGRGPHASGSADPVAWADRLPRPDPPVMPAPPLMHGTACWFCLPVLSRGGTVVTLTSRSLDPVELLDALVRHKVRRLCIIGDAFARPLLRELDAAPGRWNLGDLDVIFSSGAMLSQECKDRLRAHAPNAAIFDGLGSSESGNLAMSVTNDSDEPTTAHFRLSANTRVIDEHGDDVIPGAGAIGRLAVGGHLPLGYYKDPEKTAATFVEIGGRRYVVAGDWAEVDAEGQITLLGRGSSCINTAGEKVYPEEVEEVLKREPSVRDAAVVGVPDERFGQAVIALIELEPGAATTEGALIARVKQDLASYKAPRRVLFLPSIGRGPNGKLDQRSLQAAAVELIGTAS